MEWHRFGQEGKADVRVWHWTGVVPGDVVQSRGTRAYRLADFHGRSEETRVLVLAGKPILVIARIPGIWGDEEMDDRAVTFVCLSRHGVIVIVQYHS